MIDMMPVDPTKQIFLGWEEWMANVKFLWPEVKASINLQLQ